MSSAAIPPARRRLIKDYKKMKKDPPSGISAVPTEKDLMNWNAIIFGPDGTSWEGGLFFFFFFFVPFFRISLFYTITTTTQ